MRVVLLYDGMFRMKMTYTTHMKGTEMLTVQSNAAATGADVAVRKKTVGGAFMKGALWLGIGGFIGKLIGAIYRIPLTNIIGAEGMGLYQMIFPMYALLLTVSSSGIPTAISRLVAVSLARGNREQAAKLARTSMVTLVVFGAVCALAVFFLGGTIARSQGNGDAALAYMGIAPSLFFVAVICGYRGYFQGRQNMAPSSISQIIEQVVKMVAGLMLAVYFLPRGVAYAAFGATLGVTISEFAAMAVLWIQYLCRKDKLPLTGLGGFWGNVKSIYALSIPITLGGIILPLSQLIDSALVINILSRIGYTVEQATALYGLSGGPVGSLINMPVVLSLAIGTAVLPAIAASFAVADERGVCRKAGISLKLTMLISLPCFIGLAMFAEPVIRLLYGGLSSASIDEPKIAAQLLAIMSISVVLLAFLQVTTSILHAMGRNYAPVKNLLFGAIVKVVLNLLLLPRIGIYGVAIASVACYLTAFVLNVISLRRVLNVHLDPMRTYLFPVVASSVMAACGLGSYLLLLKIMPLAAALIIAVVICMIAYGGMLLVTGVFTEEELSSVPILGRIIKIDFRKKGKRKRD